MHRLLALVCYRRVVEVEGHRCLPFEYSRRCPLEFRSREIARMKGIRIHRNAQVDSEVSRLSKHHTVTGRVSGSHRQSRQLPIGEGILLGLAVDRHPPVHP